MWLDPGLPLCSVLALLVTQELIGMFARRRRREMSVRELAARPLRSSLLGLRFHLRDLLGSGALSRVPTPAGEVLRMAKWGV